MYKLKQLSIVSLGFLLPVHTTFQHQVASGFVSTASPAFVWSQNRHGYGTGKASLLPVFGSNGIDLPLSSFVHVPNYTLATTSESVIPLQESQRLVCLGDVHGDLKALQEFLRIAGVYNVDDNSWVGKNTILVQCGDILDRGSEELACYSLLADLSQQAKKQGGEVILLYGNHEALNAMGLFQYAEDDFEYERRVAPLVDNELQTKNWRVQYVGNQPARWATYEPGGLLAQSLMANMKVAVQVGRTLCVHAGLTTEHLANYGGLKGMNYDAQEWITRTDHSNVTFNNRGAYVSNLIPWIQAEARQESYMSSAPPFLMGKTSPIWMRDYSSPADRRPQNSKAQAMIDSALKEVDCDRMVMGHTVQKQINAALKGKAWRIDVGVSRGVVRGTPEVLEVLMKNGKEYVSVLNKSGRIPGKERELDEAVMGILSRF